MEAAHQAQNAAEEELHTRERNVHRTHLKSVSKRLKNIDPVLIDFRHVGTVCTVCQFNFFRRKGKSPLLMRQSTSIPPPLRTQCYSTANMKWIS